MWSNAKPQLHLKHGQRLQLSQPAASMSYWKRQPAEAPFVQGARPPKRGNQVTGSRASTDRGGVQNPNSRYHPVSARGVLSWNSTLHGPSSGLLFHLNHLLCLLLPVRGAGGTCGSAGTGGLVLYLLCLPKVCADKA